ncbi:MAG: hypothetical protein AAB531_02500 [Patescibacteria group bacterium]
MKKFFLLIFISFSLLILPKTVEAEQRGIGVYPPIIKITASAPSDISVPISVKNMEDKPIEATISIRPFKIDQSGAINYILYKDYTREVSALIETVVLQEENQNVSKLVFSPNGIKNLKLKIDIGKDQKEKDIYFSVLFLVTNQDSSENTRSLLSIGTATNVLLAIGENTLPSYQDRFSSSVLTSEGNLKFKITLANTGKHFMSIKPQLIIKNVFGKEIEILNLKEENILLGQTKELSNTNPDNLVISGKKYYFGPYIAILSLNTAGQETISNKSITIFVLPGSTIWLLSAGTIIILLIIQRIRVKRRKKN